MWFPQEAELILSSGSFVSLEQCKEQVLEDGDRCLKEKKKKGLGEQQRGLVCT